jgi:hypothetical protein
MRPLIIFIFTIVLSTINYSCTTIYPITATNNEIGEKVGRSRTGILFGTVNRELLSSGLVLNEDYGVINAIRNGEIDTLATLDLKVQNYGIYQRIEIIATGK